MPRIDAIFQNGVFVPKESISLPESCEVQLDIVSDTLENPRLQEELELLRHRSLEQTREARSRISMSSRPVRQLPTGKTLSDMVEGKWPGEESDQTIDDALDRIS